MADEQDLYEHLNRLLHIVQKSKSSVFHCSKSVEPFRRAVLTRLQVYSGLLDSVMVPFFKIARTRFSWRGVSRSHQNNLNYRSCAKLLADCGLAVRSYSFGLAADRSEYERLNGILRLLSADIHAKPTQTINGEQRFVIVDDGPESVISGAELEKWLDSNQNKIRRIIETAKDG
jgi:hypothetical protein